MKRRGRKVVAVTVGATAFLIYLFLNPNSYRTTFEKLSPILESAASLEASSAEPVSNTEVEDTALEPLGENTSKNYQT